MKKHSITVLLLLATNGVMFGIDPTKTDPGTKPEPQNMPQSIPEESLPMFGVNYFNSMIQIYANGYFGNVDVFIHGEKGYSLNFQMDGTLSEFIDISNLPEGTYTLEIVTDDGVVYCEEFIN